MKGISTISSLLSLQVWPLTLVDAIEYLEPNVQRIERVLPLSPLWIIVDICTHYRFFTFLAGRANVYICTQ